MKGAASVYDKNPTFLTNMSKSPPLQTSVTI